MALSWVIDIYHLNHKVWDLLEMIHLNIKVRLNNKDLCIFLKWFYSRWKTQLKLSRFPSTSYLDETLSELICWPRDCWALLLTVHRVLQHEIRDVLTALYSLLCTHYFVLSALYSLLYILYSVFCIFMLTLTVLSHLCSLPACDVFRSDELFYNHYIEKIWNMIKMNIFVVWTNLSFAGCIFLHSESVTYHYSLVL